MGGAKTVVIDASELNYIDGKLVDSNGREVIMDEDGNFYYADELEGSNDSALVEDSESILNDINYTGYSSEDEETTLVKEEKSNIDESLSETPVTEVKANDFIDSSGNIVVMGSGDSNSTFSVTTVNYKNIAISKRIRSGRNVEDLVKSIRSTGLINPLIVAPLVTDGMYVLIDGYRRLLACVRCGITDIPVIINNRIKTTEIPILEAMYNHNKAYNMQDIVNYIEYLEKEKGLNNPVLIEYLLALDSGDYSKLKDIILDNDPNIVDKLLLGQLTIQQAFKNLEKRRAKESKDEKDLKKAEGVYSDTNKSGADSIEETGEVGNSEYALTEEQIKGIAIDASNLDNDLDDKSLDEMVEESNSTPGFEAHKQKVNEREYIDPIIKKTVLARDNYTCKCCLNGGQSYVDILDYHHVLPVFLGGTDTPENGLTLCVACHRLVHLWSTGDLYLPKEKTDNELNELDEDGIARYKGELARFKRIVKVGDVIRKGIAQRGMNREQYKKEHSNSGIGRRKPGVNGVQEIS